MRNFLYVAAFYVISISCVKKNNTVLMRAVKPAGSAFADTLSKTYLALGDSYTIGQSVNEQDRYPVQTVNLLRLQHIKINDPDIIATTGWTTTDLLSALDNARPKKNYSLVSLLIGVNNQYHHQKFEDYTTEFTSLLARSVAYANGKKNHVFVLSIPDYSVTPFASNLDAATVSKEIDAYNSACKTISLAAGVHYVDITAISREAKTNGLFTAGDGLHPSGYQYQQWSSLLTPLMLAALK